MNPTIEVDFAGGVELLFDNTKKLKIPLNHSNLESGEISTNSIRTISQLLQTLKNSYVKQRPELFMQGDTIRPGILVVINDCDWELMFLCGYEDSMYKINAYDAVCRKSHLFSPNGPVGGLDYILEPNDKVVFISTLHGG